MFLFQNHDISVSLMGWMYSTSTICLSSDFDVICMFILQINAPDVYLCGGAPSAFSLQGIVACEDNHWFLGSGQCGPQVRWLPVWIRHPRFALTACLHCRGVHDLSIKFNCWMDNPKSHSVHLIFVWVYGVCVYRSCNEGPRIFHEICASLVRNYMPVFRGP